MQLRGSARTSPGVTGPTPTEDATASPSAAAAQADREAGGDDKVDRRGPGEPEAPPDARPARPVEPQIVLPPALQDLIESSRPSKRTPGQPDDLPQRRRPPEPAGGRRPSPTTLLDFLLAP